MRANRRAQAHWFPVGHRAQYVARKLTVLRLVYCLSLNREHLESLRAKVSGVLK